MEDEPAQLDNAETPPEPAPAALAEPSAAAETQQEDLKKKRGRPPGSKNTVKIAVIPLTAPEPQPPEPPSPPEPPPEPTPEPQTVKKPVRQPRKVTVPPPSEPKVPTPQLPPTTPHDAYRLAMAALHQVAHAHKETKQARYDAMISRMMG